MEGGGKKVENCCVFTELQLAHISSKETSNKTQKKKDVFLLSPRGLTGNQKMCLKAYFLNSKKYMKDSSIYMALAKISPCIILILDSIQVFGVYR